MVVKEKKITVRVKVEKGHRRLTIDRKVGQSIEGKVFQVYDSIKMSFSWMTREQVLKEIADML